MQDQFEVDLRSSCSECAEIVRTELAEEKVDEHLFSTILMDNLKKRGYEVEAQRRIPCIWHGKVISIKRADLIVQTSDKTWGCVIELKCVRTLPTTAQLRYYMKKLQVGTGYLVNLLLKRDFSPTFTDEVIETVIAGQPGPVTAAASSSPAPTPPRAVTRRGRPCHVEATEAVSSSPHDCDYQIIRCTIPSFGNRIPPPPPSPGGAEDVGNKDEESDA